MAEISVAFCGRWARRQAVGVHRRDGHPHLPCSFVRLLAPWAEGLLKIPRNRGTNTTLLSSMSLEGMGPSIAVEGSATKVVFEAYVEHFLAPTLRERQVVIMDNLSAHKGERVRKLIEDRGCKLLYLPPYSPDLNPIEEAFSKVKQFLRRIGARTKEALVEAIGMYSARCGRCRGRKRLLHALRLSLGTAITMKDTVEESTHPLLTKLPKTHDRLETPTELT